MKRTSYRDAIDWIAFNDGPGDPDALDPKEIQGNLTVVLISEIFGVPRLKVAKDVVRLRVQAFE